MCHKFLPLPSFMFIVCLSYVFGSSSAQNETDPCPEGYFGFRCEKQCSKNCAMVVCHEMSGDCLEGCMEGWFGEHCDYECKQGYYGANCTTPCSQNCRGHVCEPVTGACIKGCEDGYTGNDCDRVCPQGRWGKGCQGICSPNCATPHCHFQTGYCLKGCKKDYWGVHCKLFGQLKDVPDKMRGAFYNQLSAESRTVLLYVLMGRYRHTLKEAARMVDMGGQLRDELKQLLDGRGRRKRKYNG